MERERPNRGDESINMNITPTVTVVGIRSMHVRHIIVRATSVYCDHHVIV